MDVKNLSAISLDAAGIVALADLVTVATRTALTGASALLDCFVLCPGLHRQQDAPKLNGGEYPICAAMTTGYVFRVENQATVAFLQKVGRAGQLTTLEVRPKAAQQSFVVRTLRCFHDWQGASYIGTICYLLCNAVTIAIVSLLAHFQDWWALLAVGVLVFARLINVIVLRRRAEEGWKGELEPNTKSDLLVLLSQDRWVRIQGDVNDVKAVTSGEWLRAPTFFENGAVAFATLLVYLDAALAGNGSTRGKALLLILLFASAALLGLANEYTGVLKMYGRPIRVSEPRKPYQRRLHLAEELIEETGRTDWAVKLGMVNLSQLSESRVSKNEAAQASRSDDNEDQKKQAKEAEEEEEDLSARGL